MPLCSSFGHVTLAWHYCKLITCEISCSFNGQHKPWLLTTNQWIMIVIDMGSYEEYPVHAAKCQRSGLWDLYHLLVDVLIYANISLAKLAPLKLAAFRCSNHLCPSH
ncbi:hypothetical protein TNCV_2911061 [Trichonephila clavipes]|nr:hypothetical protein TNCV_2911061 [Trichonephila clavipes]